jgi:hypothetical protein
MPVTGVIAELSAVCQKTPTSFAMLLAGYYDGACLLGLLFGVKAVKIPYLFTMFSMRAHHLCSSCRWGLASRNDQTWLLYCNALSATLLSLIFFGTLARLKS